MRIDGKRVSTFPSEVLWRVYASMKSPNGEDLTEAQRAEILKVIRIRKINERK